MGVVTKVIANRDSSEYSFVLAVNSDGTIGSYSPASGWDYSSNDGITTGNWYYVTWVLSGGNMYYYINGEPYSSASLHTS